MENNNNWKGGKHLRIDGYASVSVGGNVVVLEHLRICEKVLGKPLPAKAVVHHVNGIRSDNRNENLVICQDIAYHFLLHKRMRALHNCGHADWDKCTFCKQYDDPKNITQSKYGQKYHNQCRNLNQRTRRRIKKEVLTAYENPTKSKEIG